MRMSLSCRRSLAASAAQLLHSTASSTAAVFAVARILLMMIRLLVPTLGWPLQCIRTWRRTNVKGVLSVQTMRVYTPGLVAMWQVLHTLGGLLAHVVHVIELPA
jgi:hypothetical protein